MCGVVPHEAAVISRESPAASPSVALQPQAHVALFETPPDRKPPQKAGHLTRCCKLDQSWIPCPRPSVVLMDCQPSFQGLLDHRQKITHHPFQLLHPLAEVGRKTSIAPPSKPFQSLIQLNVM